MSYKPGDSVTVSREGKVYLTQYQNVAGFASLTRVLGDDPAAEVEEMQALVDAAFLESVRRNVQAADNLYANAAKDDGYIDLEALMQYLEVVHAEPQGPTSRKRKVARKKLRK